MQPSPHRQPPEVPDMIYMQLFEAPVSIPVREVFAFPTELQLLPDRKDVALFIMARSGLASKHGINLANGVEAATSGRTARSADESRQRTLLRRTRIRTAQLVVACALPDLHRCGTASRNGTRFKRIRFSGGFLMHGSRVAVQHLSPLLCHIV